MKCIRFGSAISPAFCKALLTADRKTHRIYSYSFGKPQSTGVMFQLLLLYCVHDQQDRMFVFLTALCCILNVFCLYDIKTTYCHFACHQVAAYSSILFHPLFWLDILKYIILFSIRQTLLVNDAWPKKTTSYLRKLKYSIPHCGDVVWFVWPGRSGGTGQGVSLVQGLQAPQPSHYWCQTRTEWLDTLNIDAVASGPLTVMRHVRLCHAVWLQYSIVMCRESIANYRPPLMAEQ